jgi:hypothetical protein
MKTVLLLLLLMGLLVVGCAGPTFTPILAASQIVEYYQGEPRVVSRKSNVVSATLVPSDMEDHTLIYIAGLNNGSDPITFGTEDITADSRGRPLHVFTYEQLVRHEKIGAAFQRIGLGVSAGLRSAAAAQPSQTYVQGNVYSGYGLQPVARYSGVATTYNPAETAAAQNAINAETRAQAEQMKAEAAPRMAEINSILRTTTIYPGQIAGGIVELNNTGMRQQITVHVDFGGEHHDFQFRMSK